MPHHYHQEEDRLQRLRRVIAEHQRQAELASYAGEDGKFSGLRELGHSLVRGAGQSVAGLGGLIRMAPRLLPGIPLGNPMAAIQARSADRAAAPLERIGGHMQEDYPISPALEGRSFRENLRDAPVRTLTAYGAPEVARIGTAMAMNAVVPGSGIAAYQGDLAARLVGAKFSEEEARNLNAGMDPRTAQERAMLTAIVSGGGQMALDRFGTQRLFLKEQSPAAALDFERNLVNRLRGRPSQMQRRPAAEVVAEGLEQAVPSRIGALSRRASANAVAGAMGEGVTEMMQEAWDMAVTRYVGSDPAAFDEFGDRMLAAGVIGSAVGGTVGAPVGAVEGIRLRDQMRAVANRNIERLRSGEPAEPLPTEGTPLPEPDDRLPPPDPPVVDEEPDEPAPPGPPPPGPPPPGPPPPGPPPPQPPTPTDPPEPRQAPEDGVTPPDGTRDPVEPPEVAPEPPPEPEEPETPPSWQTRRPSMLRGTTETETGQPRTGMNLIFPRGRKVGVERVIMERSELTPSHQFEGLQRQDSDLYPPGIQGRDYHADPEAMRRVRTNQANVDIERMLDPTSMVDYGSPTVTPSGVVVAGSERAMLLQGMYESSPQRAAEYRQALTERATQYGFTNEEVAQIEGMKEPVLVRLITDPTVDVASEQVLRELNTQSDEGAQKAKDPISEANTRARALWDQPQLIDYVAEHLGSVRGAETVSQFMSRAEGKAFWTELVRAGIFPQQKISRYVNQFGEPNNRAKAEVLDMLMGAALRSGEAARALPGGLANKMRLSWSYVLQATYNNPGFDLAPLLNEAAVVWARSTGKGKMAERIREIGGQASADGTAADPAVIAFAAHLAETPAAQLRQQFAKFAEISRGQKESEEDAGGGLFGEETLDELTEEVTPQQAFEQAFGFTVLPEFTAQEGVFDDERAETPPPPTTRGETDAGQTQEGRDEGRQEEADEEVETPVLDPASSTDAAVAAWWDHVSNDTEAPAMPPPELAGAIAEELAQRWYKEQRAKGAQPTREDRANKLAEYLVMLGVVTEPVTEPEQPSDPPTPEQTQQLEEKLNAGPTDEVGQLLLELLDAYEIGDPQYARALAAGEDGTPEAIALVNRDNELAVQLALIAMNRQLPAGVAAIQDALKGADLDGDITETLANALATVNDQHGELDEVAAAEDQLLEDDQPTGDGDAGPAPTPPSPDDPPPEEPPPTDPAAEAFPGLHEHRVQGVSRFMGSRDGDKALTLMQNVLSAVKPQAADLLARAFSQGLTGDGSIPEGHRLSALVEAIAEGPQRAHSELEAFVAQYGSMLFEADRPAADDFWDEFEEQAAEQDQAEADMSEDERAKLRLRRLIDARKKLKAKARQKTTRRRQQDQQTEQPMHEPAPVGDAEKRIAERLIEALLSDDPYNRFSIDFEGVRLQVRIERRHYGDLRGQMLLTIEGAQEQTAKLGRLLDPVPQAHSTWYANPANVARVLAHADLPNGAGPHLATALDVIDMLKANKGVYIDTGNPEPTQLAIDGGGRVSEEGGAALTAVGGRPDTSNPVGLAEVLATHPIWDAKRADAEKAAAHTVEQFVMAGERVRVEIPGGPTLYLSYPPRGARKNWREPYFYVTVSGPEGEYRPFSRTGAQGKWSALRDRLSALLPPNAYRQKGRGQRTIVPVSKLRLFLRFYLAENLTGTVDPDDGDQDTVDDPGYEPFLDTPDGSRYHIRWDADMEEGSRAPHPRAIGVTRGQAAIPLPTLTTGLWSSAVDKLWGDPDGDRSLSDEQTYLTRFLTSRWVRGLGAILALGAGVGKTRLIAAAAMEAIAGDPDQRRPPEPRTVDLGALLPGEQLVSGQLVTLAEDVAFETRNRTTGEPETLTLKAGSRVTAAGMDGDYVTVADVPATDLYSFRNVPKEQRRIHHSSVRTQREEAVREVMYLKADYEEGSAKYPKGTPVAFASAEPESAEIERAHLVEEAGGHTPGTFLRISRSEVEAGPAQEGESGAQELLYVTDNATLAVAFENQFKLMFGDAANLVNLQRGEVSPDNGKPNIYIVTARSSARIPEWFEQLRDKVDTVLVDEAHNFKNMASGRGKALQELTYLAKRRGAKFGYFTATPASTFDELMYMTGVGDWGVGRGREFVEWVRSPESRRGPQPTEDHDPREDPPSDPGQGPGANEFTPNVSPAWTEQLVREMRASGSYFAASLTTEYSLERLGVDAAADSALIDQRNEQAQFFRGLALWAHHFQGRPHASNIRAVRGAVQAYVKDWLADLKLRRIADSIRADLAAGKKVVISVNKVTGDETAQETTRQWHPNPYVNLAIYALAQHDDSESAGVKQQYAEQAQRIFRDIQPAAETLEELGFNADEIAPLVGKYKGQLISADQRTEIMREFQEGPKRIAVISDAGKQGIDLHDTDGHQRVFYSLDFDWDAVKLKQAMGRVDRTGQLSNPEGHVVETGLADELRFASTVLARSEGVGSASMGEADAIGTEGLKSFDMRGQEASRAFRILYDSELTQEQRDLFTLPALMGRQRLSTRVPGVKQIMLDLLMMPHESARAIADRWQELTRQLAARAQTQKRAGRILDRQELMPNGELTLTSVRDNAGQRYGLVEGRVIRHLDTIARERPGFQPGQFVQFTENNSDATITGLRIEPAHTRRLARAFQLTWEEASMPSLGRGSGRLPVTADGDPLRRLVGADDKPARPNPTPPRQIAGANPTLMDYAEALVNITKEAGMDSPIYWGRISGRSKLGFYRFGPHYIRVKARTDMPTAAHEIGHALDDLLFGIALSHMQSNGLPVRGVLDVKPKELVGYRKPQGSAAELSKLGKALYDAAGAPEPPNGYVSEGIAEYVSLLITNPAKAKQAAPIWHEHFQKTVREHRPKMLRWIAEAQRLFRHMEPRFGERRAPTKEESDAEIDANMVTPERQKRLRNRERRRRWFSRTNLRFWLSANTAHLRKFTRPHNLPPSRDPQRIYDRNKGRAAGVAKYMLTKKMIDADGNRVGPSLKDVFRKAAAAGISARDRSRYLLALRTVAEHAHAAAMKRRVRDTGLSLEKARRRLQWVEEQSGKADAYAELGRASDKFWKQLIGHLGSYSGEARHLMHLITESDPGNYVPLQRYIEEQAAGDARGEKAIAPKKRTGSDRPVLDPLGAEVMASTIEKWIEWAMGSQFREALVNMAQLPGTRGFVQQVPRSRVPFQARIGEALNKIRRAAAETPGMRDFQLEWVMEGEPDAVPDPDLLIEFMSQRITFWRPSKRPTGVHHSIFYTQADGTTHEYQIKRDLIEPLYSFQNPWFNNVVWRMLVGLNRWAKHGYTTFRPAFIVPAGIRDTVQPYVTSGLPWTKLAKAQARTFVSETPGLAGGMTAGAAAAIAVAGGLPYWFTLASAVALGGFGGLAMQRAFRYVGRATEQLDKLGLVGTGTRHADDPHMRQALEHEGRGLDAPEPGSPRAFKLGRGMSNLVRTLYHLALDIGRTFEEAPRIAAASARFEAETGRGLHALDREEGIVDPDTRARTIEAFRETNVNFGRYGEGMRDLRYVSGFLNAAIQVYEHYGRAATKHPYRFGAAFGILLAIGLLVYLAMDDEDREALRALPFSDQLRYLNFPVRGAGAPDAETGERPDEMMRVSMPQPLWSVAAATIQLVDQLDRDRSTPKGYGSALAMSMLASYIPVGRNLPNFQLAAVIEWQTNRNNWGGVIEPGNISNREPEDRYTDHTTELFKELGQKTKLSPAKLEQAARTAFGAFTVDLIRNVETTIGVTEDTHRQAADHAPTGRAFATPGGKWGRLGSPNVEAAFQRAQRIGFSDPDWPTRGPRVNVPRERRLLRRAADGWSQFYGAVRTVYSDTESQVKQQEAARAADRGARMFIDLVDAAPETGMPPDSWYREKMVPFMTFRGEWLRRKGMVEFGRNGSS